MYLQEEKQQEMQVLACDCRLGQVMVSEATGNYSLFTTDGEFVNSVSISAYPQTGCAILSEFQVAVGSTFGRELQIFNHQAEFFELSDITVKAACFDLSVDQKFLALGDVSGNVFIFNQYTGLCQFQYQAHQCSVKQVKFFANTRALASCAADKVVCYDLNKQLMFRQLQTEQNLFECLAVEGNGELLAVSDQDLRINLFDVQTGKLLDQMRLHEQPITQLQFSDEFLVSSSWDGTVKMCQVYAADKPVVTIQEQSEVLGFAMPLVTFTADGGLNFYEGEEQVDYISVGPRIQGGRFKKVLGSDRLAGMAVSRGTIVGCSGANLVVF